MDDRERERELMRAAAAGDENAFRALVDRNGRRVYDLAYRITGNPSTAEDVVQETFLRAYRALPDFDGGASFSTWIHRIARNAAIDTLRRSKVRREVAYAPGPGLPDPTPSEAPDPERVAASGDLRRALGRAMAALSDTERVAFVLRHYEGCTTAEIGRQLGLRSSATRQTVFRAVHKLREALQPFVQQGACESGAP